MTNPDQKTARTIRASQLRNLAYAMRYRLAAAGAVVAAAAVICSCVNIGFNHVSLSTAEALADSSVPLSAVALKGSDVSGAASVSLLSTSKQTTIVSSNYEVSVDMYSSTQLESFAVQGWQSTPYIVTYTSSDESVCTVDNHGLVSGISAGNAVITATATDIDGNTATSSCNVCVNYKQPPIDSVEIDHAAVKLRLGGTGSNLNVTCSPAEYLDVMPEPEFVSSDESVCTVDESGHITAVAPGSASVTANVGSFAVNCDVTVLDTKTENLSGINLLRFDHGMIASIGNQTPGKCSLYALRYARTILDGKICSGSGMWSNGVIWSAGGYGGYSDDLSGCLSKLYSELNAGRPVIVHVQNTYVGGDKNANRTSTYEYWESSGGWNQVNYPHRASSAYYGHWVCVVGYREGADPNNLQESDFYALDPARCTDGSTIAVTNLLNGTIWTSNNPLKIAG